MDAPKTLHKGRKDIVWAIDLSTAAIHVGWTTADGISRGVKRIAWDPKAKDQARLASARAEIKKQVKLLAKKNPPVGVAVEQPSGRFRNLPLCYMAGVIQEAIYTGLEEFYGAPVTMIVVPPKTWKQDILGTAGRAADKPKPGEDSEYLAVTKARELGYTEFDWDDADAWCQGEHARRSLTFG